jgi:putative ABC transport system permease protein
MPVLSGRDFSDSDRAGAPRVAIISKAMAMQSFPGQDPLGRRISFDHGASWIRIIGTVGNLHLFAVDQKPGEAVYLPFGQFPMGTNIMVRTSADAASVIPSVRAAVHAADPDRALASVKGLDTILDESLAAPRLTATLLGLFAALTLLVTISGISGAAALGVGERRIEIGVRLAIGARPIQVIGLIVRREMTMVCAGLIVGLIVTFALARVLRAFLFQTAPYDAATFAVMTLLLATVAACACLLPARRAAVVPLSLSLRGE